MIYQRTSNALPTPTNAPVHTPPIYPLGVGTADAGLEDPAAPPTPANDNRERRQVQNWPTGKRLLQAGRREDHAMLVAYRVLLDMAWGEPANDNWRDPAPAPGSVDGRPLEDRISQRDMILDEDSILPSIPEIMELSGVPWGDDADPIDQRPTLVGVDKAGTSWRRLGGLEFINGSYLWRYGELDGDRKRLKRPTELRRPHRAPRSDPAIALSTDAWSLEDQIDARAKVQGLWDSMPASSVRIIEYALGATKAGEIGAAFHKQGKNAERLGVRLIDRAIDHLRDGWRPQIARRA